MEYRDSLIALALIKKTPDFRSSFMLIKVLSWKFQVVDYLSAINFLQGSGYIKTVVNNQISNYAITEQGLSFYENNRTELHSTLIKDFPDQREFIKDLFD